VSGYDNVHDLLVKSADISSNRNTDSMPENFTEISRVTPGKNMSTVLHTCLVDLKICVGMCTSLLFSYHTSYMTTGHCCKLYKYSVLSHTCWQ